MIWATVSPRTGHGTTDWFQIENGVSQGCILSPSLFNLYAQYIMWNARLDEAQTEMMIAGGNINNLIYADDTTLMTESEEELKSLLMKMKEEWKSWLKAQHSENEDHCIWSHHFIGNRWGNSGNSVRLYFLGSKITADGDCSHEIKTLAPWKEMYNQPRQLIKKQRHDFSFKVCLVKATVFPVVMYGCESWTIKKAEWWRIDAFELWCWRQLESPLNCHEF